MNIKKFAECLESEFDFDCYENDFYEKALIATQKQFESSTINDIPFERYYANVLHKKFLSSYLSQLKLLLGAIPPQDSSMSLSICGIDLNSYSDRIHELQSSIQKLES
ncbi:hypothetical protein [Aquimarina latercula]|uniref:hypothetical protein n=1 Tax=Aquimarina latercula TaxID=987 RepID=UPI00040F4C70|nr:hypothetical protein [Aquimarina latercula]